MKLELPPHLESTRLMLQGSLRLRPSEPVPAMPAGLFDDLTRRFASQKIVIEPKRRLRWAERLRGMLASPTFGLAAAAVMVFGVVTPFLNRSSDASGPDAFRGTAGSVSAPAMIVLVDGPAELENTLGGSGQFEAGSLLSVRDLAAVEEIAGPKVILDFASATIQVVSESGETVHSGTMPESIADLTLAVADALTRL